MLKHTKPLAATSNSVCEHSLGCTCPTPFPTQHRLLRSALLSRWVHRHHQRSQLRNLELS